jgi:hypothetical protein
MKHDLQTLPDTKAELRGIIVSLRDSLLQLEEESAAGSFRPEIRKTACGPILPVVPFRHAGKSSGGK